ncbi:MAG: SpoIIE family protein phosphatase [Clostridiales Family XIII bacterium]|jgi:sigma-B regulation protein RsbU (phosphoserine phosphatase)|nr:SpoIIE family protein phosphatase [Clostridiales Family XIII bacterium]
MASKNQDRSISAKVRGRTLRVVLASSVAVFVIAAAAIFIIRANVAEINTQLGLQASEDSADGLAKLSSDYLLKTSEDGGKLIDEKLQIVCKAVDTVAEIASGLYAHPDDYKSRPLALPDPANDGIFVPQILYPEDIPDSVREEAGLVGNLQDVQLAMLHQNPNITAMQLGSETGFLVMVDKASAAKTEYVDPRPRPWYVGAKEANAQILTEVFEDAYGRGLAITCASPYYGGDGEIAGVAAAGMLLETLKEVVDGVNSMPSSRAFVVDETGDIIISDEIKSGAALENLFESDSETMRAAAQKMVGGDSGIETVEIGGVDYFMAYSHLNVQPWTFVVLENASEVLASASVTGEHISEFTQTAHADITQIFFITLIAFAILLAVIILIAGTATRKLSATITDPIIRLTEDVRIIGNGNLDYRSGIKTGDEIETLSLGFEHMTGELRDYISNLSRVTAEKERIGAELNVATKIQASMLPRIFPPFPHRSEFDVYAEMRPAKEVGGDFYDFFLIDDNHFGIVIADVSGKSVPAALFMVIAKTLIKNQAQMGTPLAGIFYTVNNQLCENNSAAMFVTAFMGVLEIDSGRLAYVNAGHNPPVILRGDTAEWLETKSAFVLAGMEDTVFESMETTLGPNDALFLYTDGVTEAENPGGTMFSPERILTELLSDAPMDALRQRDLRRYLDLMTGAIERFEAGTEQVDDITMLVLQYNGMGPGAGPLFTAGADAAELGAVLEFLTGCMDKAGFPQGQRMNILIAAEEIFVNIANYAYAPGRGNVAIRCASSSEKTEIEFSDSGMPFNPLDNEEPDITLPAEQREIGGLGVYMVKNMMDESRYRFEDGKNILTIVKFC